MSSWRDRYQVHPVASVFPMMEDEELAALGEDIKTHGLRERVVLLGDLVLDGRNRLEAAERAGVALGPDNFRTVENVDPAVFVISANIHRRHLHLTKTQQSELIFEVMKAATIDDAKIARSMGGSPKGKQGGGGSTKDAEREAFIKANTAEGISERTAAGTWSRKTKKQSAKAPAKPKPKPKPPNVKLLKEARETYAALVAALPVKQHGAEMKALGVAINRMITEVMR